MLRAVKDRVIIKRTEEQKVSAGGIVLQRDISEQIFAHVISVGPAVKEKILVGDQLLVDWRTAGTMKHENATYYVVAEENILAVVED
jgi:chaperonin GroES